MNKYQNNQSKINHNHLQNLDSITSGIIPYGFEIKEAKKRVI